MLTEGCVMNHERLGLVSLSTICLLWSVSIAGCTPIESSAELAAELGREGHCVPIAGPFESAIVPCSDPGSLLCTTGTLGGDLGGGVYDFAASSFAGTFPVEGFLGASVMTLDDGFLFGTDDGTLNLITGDFQTNVHLAGGTDEFVDASGYIIATGTVNFATGVTTGTYVGEICIPDEDGDDDDD